MRLGPPTIDTAREYGTELRQVWEELLGRPMSDQERCRAGLATKHGGLRVQLAGDRMDTAAWAGLTAALPVANRVLPWGAAGVVGARLGFQIGR